ncbi:MAG: HAD family hydrolase [Balneolaceae bacterium]|nr:HAD family hydrolase [Balneolaceae bacterium]
MTYKYIYFDLDDTLLDHRGAEKAALQDLINQLDYFSSITHQELTETYHRINSKLWTRYGKGDIDRSYLQRSRFEQTLNELGLDGSLYEEVGNFYMEAYRNHWNWIAGAAETLQKASKKFDVGILTNGFAETQKQKISQFSLADVASNLVISEEVAFLKPQPEIFKHATALTRKKPQEILYIGDSYTSDVIGGASFGWNVAWYTNGDDVSEERKKDAYFTFNKFSDLCSLLKL